MSLAEFIHLFDLSELTQYSLNAIHITAQVAHYLAAYGHVEETGSVATMWVAMSSP